MTITKRMSLKYTLTNIAFFSIWCCIIGFAYPYLSSRNFTAETIGISLGLSNLLSIFTQNIYTKFIAEIKSFTVKKAIILNMIIILVLLFLLNIISSYYLVLIIYALISTILYNTQPLIYSIVFEYINNGININFGFSRGIGSLSFAFSSLFIGYLGSKLGYKFPYAIIILAIIGTLFLLSIVYKYDNIEEKNEEITLLENKKSKSFLEIIREYKNFDKILIGIGCLFFAHMILNTYLLKIVYNITLDSNNANLYVGICLMIAAIVEFPTMAIIGKIYNKIDLKKLIIASSIFYIIKSTLTLIAPNIYVLYFAQLTQIGGYAILLPGLTFYISKCFSKEDNVAGQSYINSALTTGGILGNSIGGKIITSYGIKETLILATIMCIIGATIITVFINIKRAK